MTRLAFRLAALPGALCGLGILVWPGTPGIARLLGLVCILSSVCAAAAPVRVRAAAPPAQSPDAVTPAAATRPGALTSPSEPTPRDMTTAMQLLGSAIVDQVDTSVQTVRDENHNMREMAREMAAAADQAKTQFNHSMQKATEAEGSIEELQSFSGELVASIQVIGGAVKTSIDIVSRATVQAADTRGCVETMASLSASVATVVRLIDDIAGKTRMLALNATIEAARAGEAGRGFAVVAGEVKDLAQQTAAATGQIGAKIREMTAMVDRSVAALQALVATIESVDAASESIGQAITNQETLANRVSSSLTDMRASVFTLSREIREAAQIAANSGMLSDLVLETANSVDGLMSGLNDKLRTIGEGMIPAGSSAAGNASASPDAIAFAS